MTLPIVMKQYKGDGNYDIMHPETDSSMITDFKEATNNIINVPFSIRNNGIFVEGDENINIHKLYKEYEQGKLILAVARDYTEQFLDTRTERILLPLVYVNQTHQTVENIKFYTDIIIFQIFKDNVSLRFYGSCTYREDQTEDFQDIWSWGLAKDIYENKANLTQTITASSKAHQYPSAAAVYNAIGGAVQITQITKTIDGSNTNCAYPISDKLPHYAIIDDVTTAICTITPTIAADNFNEHRVLVINNNQTTLGAQIDASINPIGGATTAYSIPVGGMVELAFRRISASQVLAYYIFVNETNI